ncbi:hypothetical protein Aperf_G00000004626 [Anoplocephala perfoliata]
MDEVQWNININMNPLQLSNPRTAFESYTKPLMNKYVPDLKGILIHVDYQTLTLKTSPDLGNFHDIASGCIIRFHPIYPVAKVNMIASVTVFCPSVGLQVDADVRVVKHDRLVCRFGDNYSIFVTVLLRGEEAVSLPLDPETNEPIRVFTGDKVRLEISRVNVSVAGDDLRLFARVLSILTRGNFAKKRLGLSAPEPDESETPINSKNRKRKRHEYHGEETATEPQRSAGELDAAPTPSKKKEKSNRVSKLEGSILESTTEKDSKNSHRHKKKSHDFLAVKPDPDGQPNAYGQQTSFQEPQFGEEPVEEALDNLKGYSGEATGTRSPDILSSADENDEKIVVMRPPKQNLLKREAH